MPGYVGSKWIRATAVGLAVLCVVTLLGARQATAGSTLRWMLTTGALVTGVATAACLPLSSRRFYPIWMRWAERLNALVMTLLFGACYLLIVPLFFLLQWKSDPLRLRSRSQAKTFWRPRPPRDARSFERMG